MWKREAAYNRGDRAPPSTREKPDWNEVIFRKSFKGTGNTEAANLDRDGPRNGILATIDVEIGPGPAPRRTADVEEELRRVPGSFQACSPTT